MRTLKTAIKEAGTPGTDLHRAVNQLDGCPAGGWGETVQARSRIADVLPLRAERKYTASELIDAVLEVNGSTGRYQWISASGGGQ